MKTEEGKFYWVKKADSPEIFPMYAGELASGKKAWVSKPSLAIVYKGGPKLNEYLASAPNFVPVEVKQQTRLGKKVWAAIKPRKSSYVRKKKGKFRTIQEIYNVFVEKASRRDDYEFLYQGGRLVVKDRATGGEVFSHPFGFGESIGLFEFLGVKWRRVD